MIHETCLEQQNIISQIFVSNSFANIANNNNYEKNNYDNNNHGNNNYDNIFNSNARGNYRGRGGRVRGDRNNRLYCQLTGHDALKFHKRFDIYWQGNPTPPNYQGPRPNISHVSHNFAIQNHQNHNATPPRYQSFISQSPTATSVPESSTQPTWFVDSGATNHIIPDFNNL